MRRYAFVVALMAIGSCASSVNVEQEREALLAADREWASTVKDTDKFLSYFAADATVYAPGMPAVTGSDAIRKAFSEMTSAPGFALSFTPAESVVAASGDIGYTSGTYEMSAAGSTEKGKYVTVWKKDGDAWKVTEDIFNADSAPQGAAASHVMISPGEFKWTDGPPSLPPGGRIAVVSGDPTQAEAFVLRAQVPAGYKVPPHWHPGVENLTVLSGTIALGMGDQWDESKMTTVATGGYASLPAEMRHSFLARSAATFQVHGMGPFAVNYVNPADDPSKQQK
jgi:ketosteroid isomerase-like protein